MPEQVLIVEAEELDEMYMLLESQTEDDYEITKTEYNVPVIS